MHSACTHIHTHTHKWHIQDMHSACTHIHTHTHKWHIQDMHSAHACTYTLHTHRVHTVHTHTHTQYTHYTHTEYTHTHTAHAHTNIHHLHITHTNTTLTHCTHTNTTLTHCTHTKWQTPCLHIAHTHTHTHTQCRHKGRCGWRVGIQHKVPAGGGLEGGWGGWGWVGGRVQPWGKTTIVLKSPCNTRHNLNGYNAIASCCHCCSTFLWIGVGSLYPFLVMALKTACDRPEKSKPIHIVLCNNFSCWSWTGIGSNLL